MSANGIRPPRPDSRAIRGRVLTFIDDPAVVGEDASFRYFADGLVVIEDGHVTACDDYAALAPGLVPETAIDDYSGCLVIPGMIDIHCHYPQGAIIASHGAQLLEWLEKYTFPEESKFADEDYAGRAARYFFDRILASGTTTAAVYCTVHEQSVDAFFTESEGRGTRMIAGKVMMDRNAPEGLRDSPEAGYRDSRRLIGKWHRRGRQLYAVTPRFALTSSPAQLDVCATLMAEFPDCYLQTHLAENKAEVETAGRLFPEARDYTDIYDAAGLLGPRSIFGHGIHLADRERQRLHESRSVIAFCPSSNLFMGSGLFDFDRARGGRWPLRVGIASDIGAGTSFSMLATLHDAYKAMQLQGQNLSALRGFHAVTLGNARVLGLGDKIGAIEPGHEADITVLDPRATPVLRHRMDAADGDFKTELFALMMLGDAHCVRATYVAGRLAAARKPDPNPVI